MIIVGNALGTTVENKLIYATDYLVAEIDARLKADSNYRPPLMFYDRAAEEDEKCIGWTSSSRY